jgi:hypothetical protein
MVRQQVTVAVVMLCASEKNYANSTECTLPVFFFVARDCAAIANLSLAHEGTISAVIWVLTLAHGVF